MSRLKLHHWILMAMGVGAGVGLTLNVMGARGTIDPVLVRQVAEGGKAVGDLWLRLLQMLVVPLIVSSLITGVTGMGNLRQLGRLGRRTVIFYLSTSMIAIATGLVMVNLISPGVGVDLGLLEANAEGTALPAAALQQNLSLGQVLWAQLNHMIPKNAIKAAADGAMLPIIFFSLFLGVFINAAEHETAGSEHVTGKGPESARVLRGFFNSLFDVTMRMTLFVVKLAPIGVLGFMLFAAAGKGLDAFRALGLYALTVFLALAIHAGITLPLILKFFARRSPLAHAQAMAPALVTAFSTASSNGTLPLTMNCVEKRAGVSNQISSFVLPLGATINMDGTALYEVVAVLFIAQVTGLELTMTQQLIVAFTALLASIGAAGIPHAGTVMMLVVLSAVGLPTSAVGLILAVDRILDMCRTTVNVWSDSAAAAVVARYAETDPPAPKTA
ncbi:MAG: dicarboxylate/amino acid:cation symporter [Deltaproteobacteria bacterium]